ncbi:hypothetical protein JOQ06_029950 [Pogonophryne albipinna]|uniref:Uncharacterized protein n=1 Tax=Pogonophryne albipinna TaxID=1090488 RepID=A0AAD6AYL2_9TELE|nr:hypothetical protein JOQ06_029950 [Pogonophryne albipinna]
MQRTQREHREHNTENRENTERTQRTQREHREQEDTGPIGSDKNWKGIGISLLVIAGVLSLIGLSIVLLSNGGGQDHFPASRRGWTGPCTVTSWPIASFPQPGH